MCIRDSDVERVHGRQVPLRRAYNHGKGGHLGPLHRAIRALEAGGAWRQLGLRRAFNEALRGGWICPLCGKTNADLSGK